MAAFAAGFGLGTLLNQFEFIKKTATDFMALIYAIPLAFKSSFLEGLKSINTLMFESVILPFRLGYNFIMSLFGGKSPSLLAMNIVAGLSSAESLIFSALTNPFRNFSGWLSKMPFTGNASIEPQAMASYVPAVSVTPAGTTISASASAVETQSPAVKERLKDETTMRDLLDSIDGLRDEVKKKNMDVYLDSSLISSLMARGLDFHGNYGVNK
jgi:hypothetical protein